MENQHQPTGNLMGLWEIGNRLGVSRQRVHQITEQESFPPAADVLHAGRIWRAEDVERWVVEHRPGIAKCDHAEHDG